MTVAIIVAEDDQGDRYSEDSFLRDGCLWWGGYGGVWWVQTCQQWIASNLPVFEYSLVMFSWFLHDRLLILCLGLLHTVLWNQPCQRIYCICVTQAACLDLHLHLRISGGPVTACLCQGNWRMATCQEEYHDFSADEPPLPSWHVIQIRSVPARKWY